MATEAVPNRAGGTEMADRSATRSHHHHRSSRGAPLPASDRAFAIAAVAAVFVEHLLFGTTQDHLILAAAAVHLVLALTMLSIRRYRRRLASIPLAAIGVPFGVFLLIALVATFPFPSSMANGYWQFAPGASGAISVDPFASRLGLVQLAGNGALFVIGVMLAADDNSGKRLLHTITVAALVFSVWAFVDHLTDPRFVFGTDRGWMMNRLGAAFGSANTAATLFGIFVVLSVSQLMASQRLVSDRFVAFSRQGVPGLLVLFAGSCLVLTASRAGVAATVVALVMTISCSLWLRRQRRGTLKATAKVAVPAALLIVLFELVISGEQLLSRSERLDVDSALRTQLNSIFWIKALEAPLFGHGVGSFWSVAATATDTSNAELMFNVRAAHNSYLQWLLQAGFVGATALLASLTAIAWRLAAGLARRSRGRSEILAVLSALIVCLLHASSDYSLEVPSMGAFLAIILGAGVSLATPSRARRPL